MLGQYFLIVAVPGRGPGDADDVGPSANSC